MYTHPANPQRDWLACGPPRSWPARPRTLRRLQAATRQAARLGEPNWPKGPALRDLVRQLEGGA